MKYTFQAKSSTGEVVNGKIDAVSNEAAVAMLQSKGYLPLKVEKEKETSETFKDLKHLWEGVSLRELSVFYRQLATLIDAKVSIIASLRAVGDQTANSFFKIII